MTIWHPEKDLNSHLAVLETVVLAVELSRHMEERVGFEPTELSSFGVRDRRHKPDSAISPNWRFVRELNPSLPADNRVYLPIY